jgi:signal transduction histidine kinase
MGLDIARRLIEAHHGTISCTSTPKTGTVFTIRLPLAPE